MTRGMSWGLRCDMYMSFLLEHTSLVLDPRLEFGVFFLFVGLSFSLPD